MKLLARSESPAAKSRQAQIDRENLILIKKIVALDNSRTASTKSGHGTRSRNRPAAAREPGTARSHKQSKRHRSALSACPTDSALDRQRNSIVVPSGSVAFRSHACQDVLPDVPPAACHALYTRGAATMRNNFAETNGSTLTLSTSARRQSTHVKIQDENKRLLQRILSARTSYSRAQWSEQERERLKLLGNISRHGSHTTASDAALRASASTSRLASYDAHARGSIARTRHSSSSSELTTLSSHGIRLDETSHLATAAYEPQQQQRQRQHLRSQSASAAAVRRSVSSASTWERQRDADVAPLSCRSAASESLVQRMRSMTVEQRMSSDAAAESRLHGDGDRESESDNDTDELLRDLS